jgi:uncharacterized alkaline shock family protein YloU
MSDAAAASSGSSQAGGSVAQRGSGLVTEKGKTSIADSVVAKIAGVAAREVDGVHDMGAGAARAVGALKGIVGRDQSTQGVSVEVGERQAAVDLDLIVDYGVSIPDVAEAVRRNVVQRVERMTGLEATEVNISVDDVWLGQEEPAEARVE